MVILRLVKIKEKVWKIIFSKCTGGTMTRVSGKKGKRRVSASKINYLIGIRFS